MSAPVAVVIATYRPLGAVVPLRGLREQNFRGFKGFDIVLVTEIGAEAWGGEKALIRGVKVVEAPFTKYHSPTHALNLGISSVDPSTVIVALLADFAFPDPNWLQLLVVGLIGGASFIGGNKCPHGLADSWTCRPKAPGACTGRITTPAMGHTPDVSHVYPCQSAYNLGNAAFRLEDAKAINGLDERFAGDHGHEDENFVRRLVAHTKQHAVLSKHAVVHHYWPYSSGYKPLLQHGARPWAFGMPSNQLDRLLTDCEILVGNTRAPRVPIVDVSTDVLVHRTPSAPYEDAP